MADCVRKYALTEEDVESSVTLQMLPSLLKALSKLEKKQIARIIDLGCGYGGLTRIIADYLGAREAVGVDSEDLRLRVARKRLTSVVNLDLDNEQVPYPDGYFDLVTSFGVMEHLVYFDSVLSEVHRILKPGGYLVISLPNLGSWVNRIALLLGYQPRDVEISARVNAGALGFYAERKIYVTGHLHTGTCRAMKELLSYFGFAVVCVESGTPNFKSGKRFRSRVFKLIDELFSACPSLGRRLIIVAQKP